MYQLNTDTISKCTWTNWTWFFFFPLQHHCVKTVLWTWQRKFHTKSPTMPLYVSVNSGWSTTELQREEKSHNRQPSLMGMAVGCLCWSSTWCPAQPHETWLDLLTAAESFHWGPSLSPQNLDKAATASLAALHPVPATEVIGLNTFAQNIMKHAAGSHLNSLHGSPTCTETCWSQNVANKGRAQLNIHFPRHLLLPIPFLLFSTPLTLRTHCRCCYFVCFGILLPRSRLVPLGFSSCFPQVKCSFSQLDCLSCWLEITILKGWCRDHTVSLISTCI